MSVEQTREQASAAFVQWMHGQVMSASRGDRLDTISTVARDTFWLGRLAPEDWVLANPLGARGERLDPCAIGVRIRPSGPSPWTFEVKANFVCWPKVATSSYEKSPQISVSFPAQASIDSDILVVGTKEIAAAIEAAGLKDYSAEIRIEVESWRDAPEIFVTFVNTSPAATSTTEDHHIYEAEFEVVGLSRVPFELAALPDSFRYDRRISALGFNCGVITDGDAIRTSDVVVAERGRPTYWTVPTTPPDLSFATLAADPLPQLTLLSEAVQSWGTKEWGAANLDILGAGWSPEMRAEADRAASGWEIESARIVAGLNLLTENDDLRLAFRLANEAIAHAARGKYDGWRPFQVGFLLASLASLVDPDESDYVDTVWFATGGGKTETYLGLLMTAVIFDRITGKGEGITAWSRFPLRMLSLQQTQRFADALAGAELVRRRENIPGAPIRLGFYVGAGGTPNRLKLDPDENGLDPMDPDMPVRFQVLLHCPFCRADSLEMRMHRASWTLQHCCTNKDCPWPDEGLPIHIIDDEIYRFLPSVVVGTIDKAALLGSQAAMRGFVGPPLGRCDREGHGYSYSARSKTPSGCLVPGCKGSRVPITQDRSRWAPTFRLQDELHLIRDSLGAVDSHYESLLDHLQSALGSPRAKVIASSATLAGFDRQSEVLYQRHGRVFPLPGPTSQSSFWSAETDQISRKFVAIAPRGVTAEFVIDRTLSILQGCVRSLLDKPSDVCREAGIDESHVEHLLSNYGVNVAYGNTLRDVDAMRRSAETQVPFDIESVSLTGGTPLEDVRQVLDRLDHPEEAFEERIHLVTASSMLSHGVDIDRLNIMVVNGLPLTTAEFIQTTARVGRRWPGIIYVLHRIAREREMATFSHFEKFVQQGDRFVEPIAVTRRSRKVLALTIPGLIEARRLAIHEPASGRALTMVRYMRDHYPDAGITAEGEQEALTTALGFTGPLDELHREDLKSWLQTYFVVLRDPATNAKWPKDLSPSGEPMNSLRDVEEPVSVRGND